jgi:hypothetical protein
MRSPSKPWAPVWFQVLMNRLAAGTSSALGLFCLISVAISLYHHELRLAAFQAVMAALFASLAWLYLKGPLSRVRR